ncbi:MAG: YbjN domain-containing protein [Myxococcales bacterium]|nr:YbjN domain-containing protein [Myxococcales bacterium]
MSLFENPQETNLKVCVEMVEAVLAATGVNPAQARITAETGPAWALTRGSAEVYIFLSVSEGDNYIQVVAPVLRPDSDAARDRLYVHLLELNANELTGAAFGLRGGDVVLTTDRSTIGLDRVEVEEMIRRIGEYADHFDDTLTAEFGGTRHTDV